MTEQASALERQGLERYQAGDMGEALRLFEKAREMYAREGDVAGVIEMWNDTGVVYYRQRSWTDATLAFSRAEEVARAEGERAGLAKALGNMGSLAAKQGDAEQAEASYNEAVAIFRELGDHENAEATLKALSDLTLKRGQWVESLLVQERDLQSREHLNLWQRIQLWVIKRVRALVGL